MARMMWCKKNIFFYIIKYNIFHLGQNDANHLVKKIIKRTLTHIPHTQKLIDTSNTGNVQVKSSFKDYKSRIQITSFHKFKHEVIIFILYVIKKK